MNEKLLTSHLQAVWLAASEVVLAPGIPRTLDLSKPGAPLRKESAAAVQAPRVSHHALPAMQAVFAQILSGEGGAMPDWMTHSKDVAAKVAKETAQKFNEAFDRWRNLYRSAKDRLHQANDLWMRIYSGFALPA